MPGRSALPASELSTRGQCSGGLPRDSTAHLPGERLGLGRAWLASTITRSLRRESPGANWHMLKVSSGEYQRPCATQTRGPTIVYSSAETRLLNAPIRPLASLHGLGLSAHLGEYPGAAEPPVDGYAPLSVASPLHHLLIVPEAHIGGICFGRGATSGSLERSRPFFPGSQRTTRRPIRRLMLSRRHRQRRKLPTMACGGKALRTAEKAKSAPQHAK